MLGVDFVPPTSFHARPAEGPDVKRGRRGPLENRAFLRRAFHAVPPLTSPKGELVNAVHGFTSMLFKAWRDLKPRYVIATFDYSSQTFRKAKFADYKATRGPAPEGLAPQFPRIFELLDCMSIPIYQLEGYEADDLLGTLSKQTEAEKLEIQFICGNANALEAIADNSCDLVVAAMSLMDVEDYLGAVREIRRVLCNGGSLLMSITHPCFTPRIAEWERHPDDRHQLLFFKVDRYFNREVWEDKITKEFSAPVLRRHRPLQDYVEVLLREGFLLREFCEAEPTADELRKSDRFRKLTRIPYFLFMRWEKS